MASSTALSCLAALLLLAALAAAAAARAPAARAWGEEGHFMTCKIAEVRTPTTRPALVVNGQSYLIFFGVNCIMPRLRSIPRAGFPDERGVGGGEGAPAGVGQRRARGGVLVAGRRAAPNAVVQLPALRRHPRRLQVQLRQYVLAPLLPIYFPT